MRDAISVEQLSKRFEDVEAISGISFIALLMLSLRNIRKHWIA